MQINNNSEFIKAVTIGSSMAGKNKTIPILEYAKVTFKQGRIIVSSYDSESAITKVYQNSNETTDNVSFCISHNDFLGVLKALNDQVIDIDVNDKNVQIKHSNGVITLPIYNAEEYPTPAVEKEVKTYDISSELLFNVLKEAKNFVGRDEIRPAMKGVRLLFNDNTMTVSSTDAHVLYNNVFENKGDEQSECILSSSIIPTVMSILQSTETTNVSIGQKNIVFKTDDCKVIARVIEGRYPNVNAVIPTSHSTTVKVSKKDFVSTLNRAMITASKATTMVKLNIKDGMMEVETEDVDYAKSSKEKVKVNVEGNDILIGLNCKMLLTCIDNIESEEITMEMSAPNRAVVLKDSQNESKTVLIMPVMIQ